jgi:hypothetical protein
MLIILNNVILLKYKAWLFKNCHTNSKKDYFSDTLNQGRPTQVGLWAADQLFSHILGRNLSKT